MTVLGSKRGDGYLKSILGTNLHIKEEEKMPTYDWDETCLIQACTSIESAYHNAITETGNSPTISQLHTFRG